ncbi:hypothetical protein EJB05_24951 [Eragrostis curvula]|uniref:Phytocyanin domain-containing protein n=1 Tax=Eragrostis curvula TaxID=38414 RepID=A0A5J9VB39_9POAL|nr:hypothetical protein EJB05_24951 [Eragrostis curvula]
MAAAMSLRFVVALAIAVLAAAALLPAAAAAREGKQYKVGGPDGWVVPPPEIKEMYYTNWASGITFYVKDSLEFVFKNDSVIPVGKAGYYHCTVAGGEPAGDGFKTVRLDAPGYAYFASGDVDRCKMGERLMINVLAADQPASPGPSAPGPSSSAAASHCIAASSVNATVLAAVSLAMAGFL